MARSRDPLAFSAEQPKQVYQQLREHVREMIVAGALPAGSQLPTTKQLAAKWSVPAATVQAALAHLVKEGLLIRIRKKGTFVLDRNRRLERIGAYYDTGMWSHGGGSLKQAVHLELLNLCGARGITLEPFFDARKPAQRTSPPPELLQAIETRRIQALVGTDIAAGEAAWIDRLPVPTAFFLEAAHPTRIDLDFEQFLEIASGMLQAQGCRSVGLISLRGPWKPPVSTRAATNGERDAFLAGFAERCQALGLKTSPDWIKVADTFIEGKSQLLFGYEKFLEIWDSASRPDGLIVYPDSCANGVVIGVLEHRVDVPGKLRLALHKRRELDYLCPLDASFIYSSAADVAKALLLQVADQFEGRERTERILPFQIEEAASARQPARAARKK